MIKRKSVAEYLFDEGSVEGHITHSDYIESPGTAFLAHCLEAKDSMECCKKNFPKNADNENLSRESLIRIQHIINATLSLLMGHFETYQKYLFAGTFERTIRFSSFNSDKFFRLIGQKDAFQISPIHLLGYRGNYAASGVLVADNLGGWHDPKKVNKYFDAFEFQNFNFYANDDIEDLSLLWQFRHSIVHTAATLTRPDSQKIQALANYAGRNIVFTNKFIYELSKRMHKLVAKANKRLYDSVSVRLRSDITPEEKSDIDLFYDVKSKNSSWLS